MAVRNLGWLAANSTRRYPLDDRATGEDSQGEELLRDDLVVDLCLRWPDSLGRFAYLGGVHVTARLVSVTFAACLAQDRPADFQPLAALSLPQPVTPFTPYFLEDLGGGAGGWVVFGPGIRTPYRGRFAGPREGLLLERCAQAYRARPVTGLGKEGGSAPLEGLVLLRGSGDLEVVGARRTIDGRTQPVAVVRLKPQAGSGTRAKYVGPCGGRPESGTCPQPPVQTVGGVGPDCQGNLTMTFTGAVVVAAAMAGLVLDTPLGVLDACAGPAHLPDSAGNLPGAPGDDCATPHTGSAVADGPPGAGPLPPREISSAAASAALPFTESFLDGTTAFFEVLAGEWDFVGDHLGGSLASIPWGSRYRAADRTRRNVSCWDANAYASSLGKSASVRLRFDCGEPADNGGLVLNWHQVGPRLVEEYFYAAVDRARGELALSYYNGSTFHVLGRTGPLALSCDHWLSLTATINHDPANTLISLSLVGLDQLGLTAALAVTTSLWGPPDGLYGLAANQSLCDFEAFTLAENP